MQFLMSLRSKKVEVPKLKPKPKSDAEVFKKEAERHVQATERKFIISSYRIPHGKALNERKHMQFDHECNKSQPRKGSDYKQDANLEFYKKSAIEQRKKLFKSKLIEGQIMNFWKTYKLSPDSVLPKRQYLHVHMLMSKALDPQFKKARSAITAIMDWRHDLECLDIVSCAGLDMKILNDDTIDPEHKQELEAVIKESEEKKSRTVSNLPKMKGTIPRMKRLFTGDEENMGLTLWQFKRSMFEMVDHWTNSINELDYARFLFRLYSRITVSLTENTNSRNWKSLAEVTPLSREEMLEPLKKAEEEVINALSSALSGFPQYKGMHRGTPRLGSPNLGHRKQKVTRRSKMQKIVSARSKSAPKAINRYSMIRKIFQRILISNGMIDEEDKKEAMNILHDAEKHGVILDLNTRLRLLTISLKTGFVEAVEFLIRQDAKAKKSAINARKALAQARHAMDQAKKLGDWDLLARCFQIIRLLTRKDIDSSGDPTISDQSNLQSKILLLRESMEKQEGGEGVMGLSTDLDHTPRRAPHSEPEENLGMIGTLKGRSFTNISRSVSNVSDGQEASSGYPSSRPIRKTRVARAARHCPSYGSSSQNPIARFADSPRKSGRALNHSAASSPRKSGRALNHSAASSPRRSARALNRSFKSRSTNEESTPSSTRVRARSRTRDVSIADISSKTEPPISRPSRFYRPARVAPVDPNSQSAEHHSTVNSRKDKIEPKYCGERSKLSSSLRRRTPRALHRKSPRSSRSTRP